MGIISSNPEKNALKLEPAYYYDKYYGEGTRSNVLTKTHLASNERLSLIPSVLKKKSEILETINLEYPFVYGPIATSSLAFLSSVLVVNKFRNFFELGTKGHFATLSSVCLPSFFINLGLNYYLDNCHNKFFNTHSKIYPKENSKNNVSSISENQPCPLCYEIQTSLVQITSALIWPIMFSPIICGYASTVLNLKPLPSFNFSVSDIKNMFKFYFISPFTNFHYSEKHWNIQQKSGNLKYKYFWAFLGMQVIMAMILKEYQINKAIEIDEKIRHKLHL